MSKAKKKTPRSKNERQFATTAEELEYMDLETKRIAFRKLQQDQRNSKRAAKFNAENGMIGYARALAELEITQIGLEAARRAASIAEAEDAEQRQFTFSEHVDDETCKAAIAELDKLSHRFPKEPLTIILNSPGGSVLDGLGLYDHLQELRARGHHITVKVRGMAASMGSILLQAGDERVIGANSHVLIHEPSSVAFGRFNDIKDEVKFIERLWVTLSKILAKRSTMTAKQIRDDSHKLDWWLDAKEAVKLGFADRIG